MQTSKRARKRKLDTARAELEPLLVVLRRAGCPSSEYRKVEFEGHEEKYRAVINGKPKMNRSAKGGIGRACTIEAKAFSFTHPHQGVCGRHGTEGQRVTSGGLAKSPGGTGVSRPISESEVASDAWSVVGRLNITYEARRKPRDRATGDRIGSGKAAGEDGQEERESQKSKDEKEEQFHE